MLVCGDARRIPLADESVQMVCTSPPYWGLRRYAGEQELVWANSLTAEGAETCEHEWATERTRRQSGGWQGGSLPGLTGGLPAGQNQFEYNDRASYANTCQKCGAWRGAYGLEPTVEMYVQHTVEVLREIRRVLRPDGVVFWNIGDSYAGGKGQSGQPMSAPEQQERAQQGKSINRGHHQMEMATRPSDSLVGLRNCGLKLKDLCGIPARVALAAQADGWWWRSDIIWAKPNPMPESVTDRPTDAYEHILMLTKSARYFWDAEAVKEKSEWRRENNPDWQIQRAITNEKKGCGNRNAKDGGFTAWQPERGRNLRNTWVFPTQPYSGAHFATFPEELPRRCIRAATSAKGACRFCGAPWERITRTSQLVAEVPAFDTKYRELGSQDGGMRMAQNRVMLRTATGNHDDYFPPTETVGWRPTCECRGQHGRTVPCLILDPFAGSGTTGQVAIELGRRAVLLDLAYTRGTAEDKEKQREYDRLAERRTRNV